MPFEEDSQDPTIWFMDHSYMENMSNMFRKVNGAICDALLIARPERYLAVTTLHCEAQCCGFDILPRHMPACVRSRSRHRAPCSIPTIEAASSHWQTSFFADPDHFGSTEPQDHHV